MPKSLNAKYISGQQFVSFNNKPYNTLTGIINKQSAKGYVDGKFEEELKERVEFAIDQREGLKLIVNKLIELKNQNKITNNDIGMIMMTFNASVNSLVRTAAIPGFFQVFPEGKKPKTDEQFDYEHSLPARAVIAELLEFINGKSNKSFDDILNEYRVAIISSDAHNIVNKYYKDRVPKEGWIGRYDNKEVKQALKKAGLPQLEIIENPIAKDIIQQELVDEKLVKLEPQNTNAAKKVNNKLASSIGIKNAENLSNDQLLDEFEKHDEELTKIKLNASKGLNLNKDFNVILQRKHGISFNKQISTAEARIKSKEKPRYRFWIPPSADDFAGLLYYTLPKGKQGEEAQEFYKKNLFDPFSIGEKAIDESIVQMSKDYKELKKQLKVRPQYLENKNRSGFTNEQSMRIWMFSKAGYEVPGLTEQQLKENVSLVEKDKSLLLLAKGIMKLMKSKEYTKPSVNWIGGSVANDMFKYTRGELRKKYMQQWQENVDQIFTEQNLNKLEFLYGIDYRIALEDSLQRMKEGRNRPYKNDVTNKVFDYLNGSTAAIMFFNTKSALLQLISNINFINWTDNNPLKAGIAFANQKQYWQDVAMLMNSNYLTARRKGLKINVSEAELADIAKTSDNKVTRFISLLLKKGYIPTQIADSIAIATGGATFYRNRVKTYLKEGLSQKEAEEKALNDFRDLSEESQQSSRPDKISMEQASPAGRVILNFANTSMQYARLTRKAALDLVNGRGDWKTNMSKILYYTFIQNLIFNVIQQAVFAMLFGSDAEDDDETQYNKQLDIANGMANSILRGLGIYGATAGMLKDVALKIYKEDRKKKIGQKGEYERAIFELFNIAPPIDSKVSKIRGALFSADRGVYDKAFTEGFKPSDPYVLPTAKVFTAITNIPLDRIVIKYNNIESAMSDEMEMWQRIAMFGGWEAWQLGIDNEKKKGHTRTLTNQYGNEDYSRDYFDKFSEN